MNKFLPDLPDLWIKAITPHLPIGFFKEMDEKLFGLKKTIYPRSCDIFKAFEHVSFKNVKVVLLGQDPYHGRGEACGLSFGVDNGIRTPPSLKNMIKELKNDLDQDLESTGLKQWAEQGVLLLNRTLTVFENEPLSHKDMGWDFFVDAVMRSLLARGEPIVFVSLGKQSQVFFEKYSGVFKENQKVLAFVHPSPLSAHRGFLGSKIYSKINQTLVELGLDPIKFGIACKISV